MNILPLVFALVMVLMVMTIEKIDSFKNQAMVETAYQDFLTKYERQTFNIKQKRLFGEYLSDISQLSFGPILNQTNKFVENESQQGSDSTKGEDQVRLIAIPLFDILYGHADFYKKVKQKRENLPEELLDAIKKAVNEKNSPQIKETMDMAWLKLGDPELQEVLYHMLKGTVSRPDYQKMMDDTTYKQGKAYVSLLRFINKENEFKQIKMAQAPLELLKAVFENEQDAFDFMRKRSQVNRKDSAAVEALKAEFIGKRRRGLKDQTLNFNISGTNTNALSKYD